MKSREEGKKRKKTKEKEKAEAEGKKGFWIDYVEKKSAAIMSYVVNNCRA